MILSLLGSWIEGGVFHCPGLDRQQPAEVEQAQVAAGEVGADGDDRGQSSLAEDVLPVLAAVAIAPQLNEHVPAVRPRRGQVRGAVLLSCVEVEQPSGYPEDQPPGSPVGGVRHGMARGGTAWHAVL
jgi:hypothetical protein